jgi:two-component system response regulator (stage 0 sporulation protein F)
MGRHTILVVEDEPSVRELAVDVLRDEGYDVVESQDGVEAIRALEQRDPSASELSLILLDMMLPGMDGLRVLGHVRALGACLPVVAMSASRRLLATALATGAQAALYKPFDLDELLGVVADHCTPCEQVPTTAAAPITA